MDLEVERAPCRRNPPLSDQSPPSARVAAELLDGFARRTGVTADGSEPDTRRRYLWTDAHAVCTWLGLHLRTGEERFLELALRLVDQVHDVLGRHRPDDTRSGWLSGLDEREARRHPTAGGLRIGKPLPERPPGASPDPRDEWDRDGQYFHYLTRWMHALDRVAQHTGERFYHRWAVELARVAHDAFVVPADADQPRRMVWKRSVDLSRPAVGSMGHLDPLDGLVTCCELQAGTEEWGAGEDDATPDLTGEIASFEALCDGRSWGTEDPLGAGGLLVDAWRWGRLLVEGRLEFASWPESRLKDLCREARFSLDAVGGALAGSEPLERRLAFRELGLALGLHAAERLAAVVPRDPALSADEILRARVDALVSWAPLAESLEETWLDPRSHGAPTWREHEDINAVALATSLVPEGYLGS